MSNNSEFIAAAQCVSVDEDRTPEKPNIIGFVEVSIRVRESGTQKHAAGRLLSTHKC